jgi:hypothetical protein
MVLVQPSAATSTIRAGITIPAGIDGDRTHRCSSSRSRGGTSTPAINAIHPDPAQQSYLPNATLGARWTVRLRYAEESWVNRVS